MTTTATWQSELDVVVDLMRNLSLQTDPQAAAELYGQGLRRLDVVPSDRYISLSRRGLQWPEFRVTRNSSWTTHPDPWKEPEKLPLLNGGIFAEILYSDRPAILDNLATRVPPTDPAYECIRDMNLLIALPHFDNGHSINAGLILLKDPSKLPLERVPMLVFQANLWGRATLNLVTQRKLQAAYNAMDRELQVVADIQRSLLPRSLPAIRNAQVAAHYQTSQRAGGDYYDFFPLPNDQWGIFVADVSGHGTPAAVLMAITHAIAHTHPGHPIPPPHMLEFLNAKLAHYYTDNNGSFVTAFYGIFDPQSRRLTYSSAGHPPPRLIRACNICDVDGESSLPLGIHAGETFLGHSLELQPNDRVLIYTDGITDTFNADGEAFGSDRLDGALCAASGKLSPDSAQELLANVLAHMETFAPATAPTDDRTMVALVVE